MNIPDNEISIVIDAISSTPNYIDPTLVCKEYRSLGLDVIPNPFSNEIPDLIIQALNNKKPFSVIRIGDGETNLLCFAAYLDTPILNLKVARKIIAMQHDRFHASPLELVRIKNLLHQSINEADIIGLIGLWRPQKRTTADLVKLFIKDNRGISGHWRAIDYLLYLAKLDLLNKKTLASAHLYFSILENIQLLLEAAEKIILITNKAINLQKYPTSISSKISYILVGSFAKPNASSPDFLSITKKLLPNDMSGTLCLIGAGPWAEIYCMWVKQRGGVAVDIGSAFDLLSGKVTRPIHNILKLNTYNRYSL